MRNTIFAAIAASLGLILTGGVVAYATAAPSTTVTPGSEPMDAVLDAHIGLQLAAVRARLQPDARLE